jgi:hypothetical protein
MSCGAQACQRAVPAPFVDVLTEYHAKCGVSDKSPEPTYDSLSRYRSEGLTCVSIFFRTYTYLTLIWINRIEGRRMSERVAGKQDKYERDNEKPVCERSRLKTPFI